jgi:hypothetical protein
MRRDDAQLKEYARKGKEGIEGWLSRVDAEIIRTVLSYQNELELFGSVAEIGVHHGKCFIELCLGLGPGERAYAIDVFEDQHLNLDKSGMGDFNIFKTNLGKFGMGTERVLIDRRSSEKVTAEEISNAVGPVRFFSVDGGHWLEIVENDLKLAETASANYGVIALDDFHRPEWPDVSAGLFRWFEKRKRPMVPFAIGFNKLYLCEHDWADRYSAALRSEDFLQAFLSKEAKFLGREVPVYQRYLLPEMTNRWRLQMFISTFYPSLWSKLGRFRNR